LEAYAEAFIECGAEDLTGLKDTEEMGENVTGEGRTEMNSTSDQEKQSHGQGSFEENRDSENPCSLPTIVTQVSD